MLPRRSISILVAVAVFLFAWGFLISCPAASGTAPALQDYIVKSWQTDDGLPVNAVNAMLQDQPGYIWLATIGGLERFDGVAFKQFSPPWLPRGADFNVGALAQTADGTLLMLPVAGGVVGFKNGGFFRHEMSDALAGRQLQSLFVDPGGAVWVAGEDGQVRRWQAGKPVDFSPAAGLSARSRVVFAADRAGGVWLASGGFLDCYQAGRLVRWSENRDSAAYTVIAASRSGGIWVCNNTRLFRIEDGRVLTVGTNLPWVAQHDVPRELFEDRHHVLWIGTSAHGLYCCVNGRFKPVAISQSQTTAIMEDSESDLWVGTAGGGLNRLRPKLFQLYNTESGLPEDVSDSVCADHLGVVWLANRNSGVVRIAEGQVTALPLHIGARNLRAYSVCADDHDMVWVSEGGLFRFPRDRPDQVQAVSNHLTGQLLGVHVIYQSHHGDIWIGTDQNLIGCFRGGRLDSYFSVTNFPEMRPRSIVEDLDGNIWIGTEEGQLLQFDHEKFHVFAQPDGLPGAPVRSLYADDAGSLWIGTMGGGLVLRRHDQFTVISTEAGLPDNFIDEILEDQAGRLWCGSRAGIFHAAKRDLLAFVNGTLPKVTATPFAKSEGLAGISCLGSSQPKAARTADGRLWFATQQGVLALDSLAVKVNTRPPPVFIDELWVNDRPLPVDAGMTVPPLCNKIEFHFSVLSFVAPQLVRLRFKLDGVDSGWGEPVNQRSAVYSALRPGSYQFHLQACNNDGVWNETGASLAFRVRPAWWQNPWFQSFLGLTFMSASALGIHYLSQRRLKLKLERLEHQQALARERSRIARDLHDDLGAMVTQVGLMVEELRRAPLSVSEIKQQSALISGRVLNLARDLDAIVWSVNPGNDSLAELLAYLGESFLECFRRTNIRPRLEVMESAPPAALAPEVRHQLLLVVKEAMNNVVKHSSASEVTLSLSLVEDTLEIRLKDNGRGFDPGTLAQSKRHGLKNMRARVEQLGGRLEATSEPGRGTEIRILLPSWKDLRHNQTRAE